MYIRTASSSEAPVLSDLAFRSKAHWGYDDDFMARCRDDLKVPESDCDAGFVKVADDNGTLAGFYRISGAQIDGKLEDLFVDPTYLGTGLGKELLNASVEHARMLGFIALEIHADPNAESFYLHMGAQRIGAMPSGSIPGRELRLLTLIVQ